MFLVGINGVPTISIHALREEGDVVVHASAQRLNISIHALREEGDIGVPIDPRTHIFLSTPSARRATPLFFQFVAVQ